MPERTPSKRWRIDLIKAKGTPEGLRMADVLTRAYLLSVAKTDRDHLERLREMVEEALNA